MPSKLMATIEDRVHLVQPRHAICNNDVVVGGGGTTAALGASAQCIHGVAGCTYYLRSLFFQG
jgi:hypothetical protein